MSKIKSNLFIRGLEICVHLGWPDIERQQEQVVLLDVDILFHEPPKACMTDKLDDTFCYFALVQHIREIITQKKFHLLEHLTLTIYQLIKTRLQDQANIKVSITKHPNIQGLTGGVCFVYED